MLLRALTALVLAATTVTVPGAEGRKIQASWHPAADASEHARAPAVVLLPDAGGARAEWTPVAAALSAGGLSVLVIERRTLAEGDAFGMGVSEVAAALKWLGARDDVNAQRLLIAGAGEGGMVALAAAASRMADLRIAGLALVSPALDADRLDDETALGDYGRRPFFIAVAKGDKHGARSALVLDGNAKGPKSMHIADGSRRGADLLSNDEEALTALVTWARITGGLQDPPAGE